MLSRLSRLIKVLLYLDQFEWIPLAPGATDVTIRNTTAVQFKARVDWGIDG